MHALVLALMALETWKRCLGHAVEGESFDFYDCADAAFTAAVKTLRTKFLRISGFSPLPVFYEQEISQSRIFLETLACVDEVRVKFSSVAQIISFLRNRSRMREKMHEISLLLRSRHDAYCLQGMDGEALTEAIFYFLTTMLQRHADCEATRHALSIVRRLIDVSYAFDEANQIFVTVVIKAQFSGK